MDIADAQAEAAVLRKRLGELEAALAAAGAGGPTDLERAAGRVLKADDTQNIVGGWAYMARDPQGRHVVDHSGDIVRNYGGLEKAAHNFVLDHRTGKVNHGGDVVAKVAASMVVTPEKLALMGVPAPAAGPVGWWTEWKLYDQGVYERVKKGELGYFSVGGSGTRKKLT